MNQTGMQVAGRLQVSIGSEGVEPDPENEYTGEGTVLWDGLDAYGMENSDVIGSEGGSSV